MTSHHLQAPTRRRFEPNVFGLALVGFALWTWGVTSGWAERTVDTWLPDAALDPRSAWGQIAEAYSLLTNPILVMIVALVLAVRSFQQRQRHLASALLITAAGVPLWQLTRMWIDRPRPETAFADSLSAFGSAYPSGHVLAVTILVWVLVTIANARRMSTAAKMRLRALGIALVLLTGVDQWAMSMGTLSDLVGGWLFGATVATGALWLGGVEDTARTWHAPRAVKDGPRRRAAIIYNPSKVLELDVFRRRVSFAMEQAGWDDAVWIETRRDDPGHEMADDARAKGVDLVLVAGGDGTARAVCSSLAGTGTPVAIIPAGTGNLLGRNLGIPLDEDEALAIALHGRPQAVDMVRWKVDDKTETFAVMAGVGLDAQIMRDTDPRLKRMVKGGAYVVAGIRQVGAEPFKARVKVDGRVVHDRSAVMTLVGNVGQLQGGINLLPDAVPDDGLLHVLIARGRGLRGMVRLVQALTRDSEASPMRRYSGRTVEVTLDRDVPYQIDGDIEGFTRSFTAEVLPRAVLVMVDPER